MSFTWKNFSLARSAAHAALGDVIPRTEWAGLDLDQSSALITDLIQMADDENWTNLYDAAKELVSRCTPPDNHPGYMSRYTDTLLAQRERATR